MERMGKLRHGLVTSSSASSRQEESLVPCIPPEYQLFSWSPPRNPHIIMGGMLLPHSTDGKTEASEVIFPWPKCEVNGDPQVPMPQAMTLASG